jgi:signal recognition particle receptor subunit alpha
LVGNKSLTQADIEPVIAKMRDHLISKNVAADVAVKLCDSVANNLEGKVLGKNAATVLDIGANL